MILPVTAEHTGGLCMPCFNNDRFGPPKQTPPPAPVDEAGRQFCELFAIKHLHARPIIRFLEEQGVRYRSVPVERLEPHAGGPRPVIELRVFVHPDDEMRAHSLTRYYQPINAIRNCKPEFKFVCPRDWNQLEPTGEAAARFCHDCEQKVFFCATDIEALGHAKQGHCIAMRGEDGTAKEALLRVGMPPPLTKEQEAFLAAYLLDKAKTTALRALTSSSYFCPRCGYPLRDGDQICIVCEKESPAG